MKWQQRPTPRGGRPMSMAAHSPSRETAIEQTQREEPTAAAPTSRPTSSAGPAHSRDVSVDEPQLSRDQIAASLGARDPTYFRQTADRGIGNAAFRKSKDETGNGDDVFAGRRGLPGLSREDSLNEGRTTSSRPESVTSETPSRFGSIREDRAWSARSSGTPSVSEGKQSSDLPFRSTPSNRSSATTDSNEPSGLSRTPTMSVSQARLANASERPPSPTKGMGGFVQSALMKRSDSQNKRWSAQPVGGLQRQDSTASARSGLSGLQGSYSMPRLDPIETTRESSHEAHSRPASRPTSSSSNLPDLATQAQDNNGTRPGMPTRFHSRSKSVASTYSTSAEQDGGLKSPLGSPSKRFSPNKSSWIESALARPDSPKLTPSRPAQPSWMENIARAKAQRNSVDVGSTFGSPNPSVQSRPSSPTKETPFGPALLKRSDSRDMRPETGSTRSVTPPTKAKPFGLSSRPTSALTQESLQLSEKMAAPTTKDETSNFTLETRAAPVPETSVAEERPVPPSSKASPVLVAEAPKLQSTPKKVETKDAVPDETEPVKSPPATKPKPEATVGSPDIAKTSSASEKTMSTPPLPNSTKPNTLPKSESATKPVTDFRSTLRSRPVSKPSSQEQPEFLSKFGSLRKAQQERYVAPDVLKDNITRGKSGLVLTDGPQKRERKDELRDSLIAKKEQWKQEKEAGVVHERTPSGPPVVSGKPEALATRELLGRKKSLGGPPRSPEKQRNVTPEALRFQKSIREKPKMESPLVQQPKAADEQPVTSAAKPVLSEAPLTKATTEPTRRLPSPSIKQDVTAEPLHKTTSLPRADEKSAPQPEEERSNTYPPVAAPAPTSKLAARFNPGLAGILARGPPGAGSPSGSRSESPAGMDASAPSEPSAPGAPLNDVRKGRAKGPKKRKGGASASEAKDAEPEAPKQEDAPAATKDTPTTLEAPSSPTLATKPSPAIKPSARFGGVSSTASIMAASLSGGQPQRSASPKQGGLTPSSGSAPFSKPSLSPKPSLTGSSPRQNSPSPVVQPLSFSKRSPSDKPATPRKDDVPEFKGFGSRLGRSATNSADEDKENTNSSSPSVKDAASTWGRKKSYISSGTPSQIQLPTRKDEEAAMRSASLLASSPARSPSRPDSSHGLGITSPIASPSPALPPKPAKSSRIVSGQLKEASPNKGKDVLSYR